MGEWPEIARHGLGGCKERHGGRRYRLQASHRIHGPGISWGFEGGEVGGRRDNSTNVGVGTRRRRGVRVAVVVGGVDSEASGSAKSAPHSAMTPMPSKTCLSTTLLFRVSSTLRLAALACCKPVNRGSHSPPSDHRRLLSPSPSHRPHELCLCLPGRSALLRRRRTAVASSSAARSRPRIWDGIFRVRQPQPSN